MGRDRAALRARRSTTKEATVAARKSFIAGALAALLALGGVSCEDPAQDGGTDAPAEDAGGSGES